MKLSQPNNRQRLLTNPARPSLLTVRYVQEDLLKITYAEASIDFFEDTKRSMEV